METEQTDKEEAKLKATIAEFQSDEICGKTRRLLEGAAKCVSDVEETKVKACLVFYWEMWFKLKCQDRRYVGAFGARAPTVLPLMQNKESEGSNFSQKFENFLFSWLINYKICGGITKKYPSYFKYIGIG